jgi:hypothetical protein
MQLNNHTTALLRGRPMAALTLSKNETVAKIAKQVESKLKAALHQSVNSKRSQK